jgi:hypothetical protein
MLFQQYGKRNTFAPFYTGKKRQKPVKTGHEDPLRPGVLG